MPSSFSHQHEASATAAAGGVEINDTTPSTTTAYSGQKIEDEIALLVTAADAPQLPQTSTAERVVVTTADENVFEDSLKIYRESGNTINIGEHEEANKSTRDESICIGASSGCLGNASHQKTCVGFQSARGTSGDELVAMGVRAFQGSTGQRITALGHYAMSQCNNGDDSVAVGNYAGQFTSNLEDSVVIGSSAGRGLTGTGLQRCVALGVGAFRNGANSYDSFALGENSCFGASLGRSIGLGRSALSGASGTDNIAFGVNALGNGFGQPSSFTGNNKFVVGSNTNAAEPKPYIFDCDMGATDSVRTIRLNADSIHVGSSLPTAFDSSNFYRIWVSDNTLRVGPYSASGPTESYGNFSKNTNSTFFDDSIIRLRWDGFDEIMITQLGLTGITDVYATAHVFTNAVSFPSSNPMILTTVENDFTQRSSAHFVDFTIRSDSDPSFPYYKIHYEVSSSTGTDLIYWNLKKYV